MGENDGVGDSDTFPSDVGNANFPDYLSASRSGAAGVALLQTVQTAELAYSVHSSRAVYKADGFA